MSRVHRRGQCRVLCCHRHVPTAFGDQGVRTYLEEGGPAATLGRLRVLLCSGVGHVECLCAGLCRRRCDGGESGILGLCGRRSARSVSDSVSTRVWKTDPAGPVSPLRPSEGSFLGEIGTR